MASLLVMTGVACKSSPNAGTGKGGAGGEAGGGSGGQSGGGSGGQATGGAGGQSAGAGGTAAAGADGSATAGAGGTAAAGAGGTAAGGAGGTAIGGAGGTATGGASGQDGGTGTTFPCPNQTSATLRCQHGSQYCKVTSLGTASCEMLPAECGAIPSCGCIPLGPPTCDSCTQTRFADIEVISSADCFAPGGSP